MSDNATNGSTARWIDRVWTVASGLLIVTLVTLAGIGFEIYNQSLENSLHLENVIANQIHAQKERDTIAIELKNRSDRWMTKEAVQNQFTAIMNRISDHEERLRAIERAAKIKNFQTDRKQLGYSFDVSNLL